MEFKNKLTKGFRSIGMKFRKNSNNSEGRCQGMKGFTLIELIVVMAVIAILVLLAAPKFLGYTEKARTTQKANDVKVLEAKIDEYLINYGEFNNDAFPVQPLGDGQLYDRTGKLDTTPTGLMAIDKSFYPEVNLPGEFFTDNNGNVVYEDDKTKVEDALPTCPVFWEAPGVSFTAFATYASLFYANGYQMPINQLAIEFTNNYYDLANGVYSAKGSKINALEKLSLTTVSTISGNNYLSLSDRAEIVGEIIEGFPQIVEVKTLYVQQSFQTTWGLSLVNMTNLVGNVRNINDNLVGMVYKFTNYSSETNIYAYIRMSNLGHKLIDGIYYPTVNLIGPNGETYIIPLLTHLKISNVNKVANTFDFSSYSSFSSINLLGLSGLNSLLEKKYNVNDSSFASGTSDFIYPNANYLPALSGKASTLDELKNLMETDKCLQSEIAKLLEKQVVNVPNELIIPSVSASGKLIYAK